MSPQDPANSEDHGLPREPRAAGGSSDLRTPEPELGSAPADHDEPAPPIGAGATASQFVEERRALLGNAVELPESVPSAAPVVRSRANVDPWAHRRGEPRVFAFCWSLYLLLAVAGSVTWVASTSQVTPDSYAPAARIMLVVVAVGATILWPMTRLSQVSPEKSAVGSTLADLVVVLLPMQMVIWPLTFLARWPTGIVASVGLLLAAWTLLAGGVLALALSGRRVADAGASGLGWRSVWMTAFLALALCAPGLMLAKSSGASTSDPIVEVASARPWPAWLPMLSPLTAVTQITGKGLMGPQRPVSPLEWGVIGWVGIAGVWLWIAAGVREGFARLREPA